MINFENIREKYKDLIDIAIAKMASMTDFEHNQRHTLDVVGFCEKILQKLDNKDIDAECAILSAFWHDVGRTIQAKGHEKLSAQMLRDLLLEKDYDKAFAEKCYLAIENHKHCDIPTTLEGHLVKDGDKIAFLGEGRWQECIDNGQSLDSIVENLHRVRNEYLYFEESRAIYDEQIVNIFRYLYKQLKNK